MSKVMELLSETVTEVKKQIQEERSEREMKKDQIMELFEGAYKKLILWFWFYWAFYDFEMIITQF